MDSFAIVAQKLSMPRREVSPVAFGGCG